MISYAVVGGCHLEISLVRSWRWEGTIGRGPYAAIGLLGFAVKHNLDRLIASAVFHHHWQIFNYWAPLGRAVRFTSLSPQDAYFLFTMVAVALPFIWVGVVLTLRRLRDAGLPSWLVALFFVPALNLLFFAVLGVLPSRSAEAPRLGPRGLRFKEVLDRMIPQSGIGSAATAIVLMLAFGLALVLLGTTVLNMYGWGVYVALPFCLALASVLLYAYHQPRRYGSCLLVSLLSVLLPGLALVAIAVEGVICVLMAAPLGCVLAMMGGAVGYFIQRRYWGQVQAPAMLSIVLLLVPASFALERACCT